MWKLVNNYLPPSLTTNFTPHSVTVRSQFSMPAPRLELASRHINYAGIKLWNEIPHRIKQIKTQKAFSKTLQQYLLYEQEV